MVGGLAEDAFEDLDRIATRSRRALEALRRDDTEVAATHVRAIERRAEAWGDPGDE